MCKEQGEEESLISVAEFERKVEELEEIVIRIRAPADAKVRPYEYDRKGAGTQSTTEWKAGRIQPLIGDFAVEIIDGNHKSPHGRTKLATLRKSYEK